jgi:hypothetical protein
MYLEAELQRFRKTGWMLIVLFIAFGASRASWSQRIGVTYSSEIQTDAAIKSLSPAAQAVIERLSTLDTIPMDDFQYFQGDALRGAALNLDDSTWQKIQIPFRASSGEVWLRK